MLAFGIVIPVLPKLILDFTGGSATSAAWWQGVFGTLFAAMSGLHAGDLQRGVRARCERRRALGGGADARLGRAARARGAVRARGDGYQAPPGVNAHGMRLMPWMKFERTQ
jgi:hypothetical protein